MPRLEVYNKVDQLPDDERAALDRLEPGRLCISARTGEGIDALVDAVAAAVALDRQRITVDLDPDDAADAERLRYLFRHGRVVSQVSVGTQMRLEVDLPRRLARHALGRSHGKASA